ncbi:hypothetical protein BKA70DRAFT_622014 [Coprinopsis sp. MPI-PUGE-AT-0042]|nr:hypothetical protein BKA70DRAFT_622014 [Coprinopsis sp. MPI-PUGE-AT-0042]
MSNGGAKWDWVGSMTRVQHLKYVNVSMLVYVAVDYIQTFPEEVAHMWGSHWSLVKILFYVTRYLPFVDLPLTIVFNEVRGLSPGACHGIFGTSNVLCVSATCIAEGLMFMRAHALSKQSTVVRRYLMVHYAIVQSTCIALALYYVQSLSFTPPFPVTSQLPCIPYAYKQNHLSAIFALVFINQLTITTLSFYFVLTNFSESRGPLIQLLCRDGVYYFLLMSSITIANFVMSLKAPVEYKYILAMPQRILHATVATRMVLRMRSSARSAHDFSSPPMSTMRFRESKSTKRTHRFGSTQPSDNTTKYTSTLEECLTPTTLTDTDFLGSASVPTVDQAYNPQEFEERGWKKERKDMGIVAQPRDAARLGFCGLRRDGTVPDTQRVCKVYESNT